MRGSSCRLFSVFISFLFLFTFSFLCSYKNVGQHAKVVKLTTKALALRRDKLGEDHPLTLVSMHNLAIRKSISNL